MLERVVDRFGLVVVLGRLVLFEDRVLVGRGVELLLVDLVLVGREIVLLRVVDLVLVGREVALVRVEDLVLERVLALFLVVALKTLRPVKVEFLSLPFLVPLM